jgi:hypothetical protein
MQADGKSDVANNDPQLIVVPVKVDELLIIVYLHSNINVRGGRDG